MQKLAQLQQDLGHPDEAAATLDSINAIDPAFNTEMHQRLGDLWLQAKNFKGAIREYRSVLAMHPLDTASAQTLMRHIDKDKLAVALQGASEPVRQFFLSNMSTRAAKMLVDDMQAMGPVRLRDVDESQVLLVNLAKDLAAKGEIILSKSRDDELVY